MTDHDTDVESTRACPGLAKTILTGLLLLFSIGSWRVGMSWALSTFLMLLSLMIVARSRHPRVLRLSAVATLLLIAQQFFGAYPYVKTNRGKARWVNRVLPEQDGAILAALGLRLSGAIQDPAFVPAIQSGYRRYLDQIEHRPATPAIATYLSLQDEDTFDVVQFPASTQTRTAVIFLHGYGGSFAMQCWHLANVVPEFDTYCPSVGPKGYWKNTQGETVLRKTIAIARKQGAKRIILAGLSNGAYGASWLINKFPRETFSHMVLVSGMRESAPTPTTQAILLYGNRDHGFRRVRKDSKRKGLKFVEIEGGHFIYLSDYQVVKTHIRKFLNR